jgi:hypothetical protein
MTTRDRKPIKISFPIGLYFEQLFSADTYVRFINPFSFWRRYRINHLETCRELDPVQYFERCHQKSSRSAKSLDLLDLLDLLDSLDFPGNENYPETTIYGLYNIFQQADANTILVFQPKVQLEYRGVIHLPLNSISDLQEWEQ